MYILYINIVTDSFLVYIVTLFDILVRCPSTGNCFPLVLEAMSTKNLEKLADPQTLKQFDQVPWQSKCCCRGWGIIWLGDKLDEVFLK